MSQEGETRLSVELETYHKSVERWSEHVGKYVLISGSDVIGFFSSYSDAIKAGYDRFKLDPFLVRQVRIVEQIHYVPPLMRIVDAPLHPKN